MPSSRRVFYYQYMKTSSIAKPTNTAIVNVSRLPLPTLWQKNASEVILRFCTKYFKKATHSLLAAPQQRYEAEAQQCMAEAGGVGPEQNPTGSMLRPIAL